MYHTLRAYIYARTKLFKNGAPPRYRSGTEAVKIDHRTPYIHTEGKKQIIFWKICVYFVHIDVLERKRHKCMPKRFKMLIWANMSDKEPLQEESLPLSALKSNLKKYSQFFGLYRTPIKKQVEHSKNCRRTAKE